MEGEPFGRYRLIELLGRGGMGEVWRAHDSAIDRVVALKMLLPHFAEDPEYDKRFRREARAAARLDDPHVVPIYDVGEIDGRLYVTMRLVTGTDLYSLIKPGPLDAHRAISIVEQIASALHNAHRTGLVHRDVKPSNILLDNSDFAYLIDFGIARSVEEERLTATGAAVGTWAYMAPERFNQSDIHPSSDIYALTCVLYECLTGQLPFPGNTFEQVASGHIFTPPPRPSEKHKALPPALDEVILTGLAKQPGQRYPTAVDMAAAARQGLTGTGWAAGGRHHRSSPSLPMARPPAGMPPTSVPPSSVPPSGRSGATPGMFPASAPSAPPQSWPDQPWTQIHVPQDRSSQHAATQLSGPHIHVPPRPNPLRRHAVLIAVLAVVVVLVAVGSVIAVVGFGGDKPGGSGGPAGSDFNGNYRADYGPGTDLEGRTVADAPATTTSWAVRSECGAAGCVATASNISGSGIALLSNLTFDQLGGTWVSVGLASAQCGGDAPSEIWVMLTLRPQPDGTLAGETVRASTDGLCAAKRTVKFTRTGPPDVNRVADPAVLPPRSVATADALHGRYQQTTTFENGNVVPGGILQAETYCLRTGDRCLSLFHSPDGVVNLVFADDKWTRNEKGVAPCRDGGTAQVTITAEYPLPSNLQDPIPLLSGRGNQTVAAAGDCAGGGPFVDQFERTGD